MPPSGGFIYLCYSFIILMDFINWADYHVAFDSNGNAFTYLSKRELDGDSPSPVRLGPYPDYSFDWDSDSISHSQFEQRLLVIEHEYAP